MNSVSGGKDSLNRNLLLGAVSDEHFVDWASVKVEEWFYRLLQLPFGSAWQYYHTNLGVVVENVGIV